MICKNCGVELEEHMNYCPLCGHPVEKGPMKSPEPVKVEGETGENRTYSRMWQLNIMQKRKLIWEVITLVVLSGILAVTLLNFIFDQSITWSVYPLIFGLGIFAYASAFTFLYGKRWWQTLSSLMITFLILFFADYADARIEWAFDLALPLELALYITGLVLYFAARKSQHLGFNLIAYVFIAMAFLLIMIEGILSLHRHQYLALDWSLIVLISVIPVAAVLLYIHFRLRTNPDLKKFFHI